jgi:hypothetical protein
VTRVGRPWGGARGGRAFEVFDEAAHFFHGEEHPGAHAAVAGDGGRRLAEGVADALFAFELLEEGGDLFDDVAGAETGGHGADDRGAFAEGLRFEPEAGQGCAMLLERGGEARFEFEDDRFEQGLNAGELARRATRCEPALSAACWSSRYMPRGLRRRRRWR